MMIPFQPLCLAHTAHGLYEQKINAKAYGEKRSHFHAGSKEIRALKTELIKRRRTETSWQRDRPRFFDQVRHLTTNASIGNKYFFTRSCHHQAYQNYEQSRQKSGTNLGNKVP